jgi:hypothetical protein
MRVVNVSTGGRSRVIFNVAPFVGQGVSLYVSPAGPIQFRNLRLIGTPFLKGTTGEFAAGATSVLKTSRKTSVSSPATQITFPQDAAWNSSSIQVGIRTFKDNVENESTDYQTVSISSGGDPVAGLLGTATLLDTQQRDGGIVRIRFVWLPAPTGLQPDTFTAIRTAGPTTPSNVATVAGSGRQIIEIDTQPLSDASPYTYKIQAASGSTTLDILTGIPIQADATGPTAPTLTAIEW